MALSIASGLLTQVRGLRLRLPGMGRYFKYHGVMAPGVRLLRVLPFGMKAALVSVCFLVPITLLGVASFRTVFEQVQQTQHERAGLGMAAQAAALSRALQAAALDAAVGDAAAGDAKPAPTKTKAAVDWQGQIDGAYTALANAVRQTQNAPALAMALRRVQTQHDALRLGDTHNIAHRLELLKIYQSAMNALVADLTRELGLALDPDPLAHELQHLAFGSFPLLTQSLSALRSAGVAYLGGQSESRWRNGAIGQLALATTTLERLTLRINALAALAPTAMAAMREDKTWKPVHDFIKLGETAVLGAAASGEVAAWRAAGDAAVHSAEKLGQNALIALDLRLAEREAALRQHVVKLGLGVSISLLVAVYLLIAVYHVMSGGLVLIREQVARMAQGDLSQHSAPRGSDEVATALHSLGASLGKLADLFAAMRQGMAAMSHATHSIAAGTTDLRQRTETASGAIADIINGITQFVDQLEDSGRRIDEAMNVVQTLRVDALHSHNQMQRLDERMKSLKGKSRKIGDIVAVIDHIAFRTNILSLNAAVEAAKAGPMGRGFAVVAQEVRSLAQRTAQSARQVSGIITSSTEDIEQCSAMADMSAETLASTQRNVLRISHSMDEIVALTRQGMNNSQTIMQQIMNLSSISDDNHGLVGQMATASDDLSQQGDRLNDRLTEFKLV